MPGGTVLDEPTDAVGLVRSYVGGLTASFDGVAAHVLIDAFAEIARLRQRLDVCEAALTRAVAAASPNNGTTSVRIEQRRLGVRGVERRVDCALALAEMPATESAFTAGALSLDHVAALKTAREFLPAQFAADEATLVAKAADQPLRGFYRDLNAWKLRHDAERYESTRPQPGVTLTMRRDGRWRLEGLLDEEQANTMLKTVELFMDRAWRRAHPEREHERAEREPYPVRFASALIAACEQALSGDGDGPGVPDRYRLGWLIDHQTIVDGLHEHSICQTDQGDPLPVWRLRQLACEVGILPIVLGGDGIPIDYGRQRRFFDDHQKQALMALDPHCMLDGCLPARQCKAHHNTDYKHGGLTDIDQGCLLAGGCHQTVHQLNLTVRREGGHVNFYRPDGTLYQRMRHR